MSKNEKKIITQKLLLKLKNLRKPDQSRIKFYNMQPFKTQVLVYFDIEITKIWFSLLSMFSNNWPLAIPGSGDFEELDDQVRSMMEKSKNRLPKRNDRKENGFASICKMCGKEGNGIDIKRHIEAIHLEGIFLPCNLCKNISRSRHSLVHRSQTQTACPKRCLI